MLIAAFIFLAIMVIVVIGLLALLGMALAQREAYKVQAHVQHFRATQLTEMVRQLSIRPAPKQLESKLITDVIQFCHPDRHNGSEKATRLTQELTKLKRQYEQIH